MKDENGLLTDESDYLKAIASQCEMNSKLCSRMGELTELVKMKQEEYNEIETIRAEFDKKRIAELEKEVKYLRVRLKEEMHKNEELRSQLVIERRKR